MNIYYWFDTIERTTVWAFNHQTHNEVHIQYVLFIIPRIVDTPKYANACAMTEETLVEAFSRYNIFDQKLACQCLIPSQQYKHLQENSYGQHQQYYNGVKQN